MILFEYALMPLYVTKMGDVFEISFLLSAIIHRLTSRALMLLSFRTSLNEYASNLVVRSASSGNSGSGVDLMCFISRYTGVVLRVAPNISLVSSLVSSARSVVSLRLIDASAKVFCGRLSVLGGMVFSSSVVVCGFTADKEVALLVSGV